MIKVLLEGVVYVETNTHRVFYDDGKYMIDFHNIKNIRISVHINIQAPTQFIDLIITDPTTDITRYVIKDTHPYNILIPLLTNLNKILDNADFDIDERSIREKLPFNSF